MFKVYLISYATKWHTDVARIRAASPRLAKIECKKITGARVNTMTVCEVLPADTKADNDS